jgi:methylglutaconyl-CoA hydratase
MVEKGYIKSYTLNQITTIEFYHPKHNSMPGYLLTELQEAIQMAGNDPKTSLIILRSAGDRTFCAGASFDELVAIQNEVEGKSFFMGFANVINAMRKCPKIIIGRIQGKAIGGGVGLASATDYCMASKFASIKLSELAVGIGPFVIGPSVQRKIGISDFSHLAINATEWQTAQWAKEKSLFQEVFETTAQLDEYITHFSEKLVGMNPMALQKLKKVFWEGTENWDQLLEQRAEISGNLVLSRHAKNAIHSFLKS